VVAIEAMSERRGSGSDTFGVAAAGPAGLRDARGRISRILLAIDTPARSRGAIRLASEVARRLGAEVVVVHVREWILGPKGPFDEGEEEAGRIIGEVARRLRADGVRTSIDIRSGHVGHTAGQIALAAQASGADLIVMGRSPASGLRGILLGSVTDKVLQLADLPVLVARPASSRASGRIVSA